MQKSKAMLTASLLVVGLSFSVYGAQFNPIQAAKDAYNKSKQQQQQKQGQQPQQAPQQSQPQATQASSSANSAGPSDFAADCCTADALKKIAAQVGFVDIVGVKLGMTPEEATAALKASNASLHIDVYNSRLEMPSKPGNYAHVPHYIIAATTAPSGNAIGGESIVVEFSTPPNPPIVVRVQRSVQFPNNQPVALGNLVSALQKKYGKENFASSPTHSWIFQLNGQPVTRPLSGNEAICQANPTYWINQSPIYYIPNGTKNEDAITLDGFQGSVNAADDSSTSCAGYVAVWASVMSNNPADPSSLSPGMKVTMESAALVHNARVATRDWLQADLDSQAKQQRDAGASRSAPKL